MMLEWTLNMQKFLSSNYVAIRNGPFRSSPIDNRRYCGAASIPSFIGNSNALRIIFNASVAAKGFSAMYKTAGTYLKVSLSLLLPCKIELWLRHTITDQKSKGLAATQSYYLG